VLPPPLDSATEELMAEIRTRLGYLCTVGLDYLNLDRQSRTLSGGEVQRINLTTALGTSLVNTLFVLDEPSIGLHPRDMERVIGVMQRLKDAGNTLVVVEHDPQIMRHADRLLDNVVWMVKIAQRLSVPVLVSEQYPKGLGPTVQTLRDLIPAESIVPKMHFSCVSDGCLKPLLDESRPQVIVCGIESHI
ncbi:hypothetical protein NK983_23865, partial [Salmonella enterica subsp. enterica serovar Typhimurium]|nr:hypothetical protein [Salmonella enterica subsp. enterica serovar Typhimurium]